MGQGQKQRQKAGKMKGCIPDRFTSLAQVQEALRKAGLESRNLIVGIDLTKSNEWNGKFSFGGQNLHSVEQRSSHEGEPGGAMELNPYQRVMSVMGRTLEPFDEDNLIPVFGFGDINSKDTSVTQFVGSGARGMCRGFSEVLEVYTRDIPRIQLSGPTCFASLIRKAIDIVNEEKSYHILLIICDGQV